MSYNHINLTGVIHHTDNPYSHRLDVARPSGNIDTLIVHTQQPFQLEDIPVSVSGEIVTKNYIGEDAKSHLAVFVRAETFAHIHSNTENGDLNPTNFAVIEGFIAKHEPVRSTPAGKTIKDFLIAVNNDDQTSYYIPAIAFGKLAWDVNKIDVGKPIIVHGRLQSRNYTKNGKTRTAYELVVNYVESITEREANDA